MKTAVSIPDKLFQNAERTAKKLGIPRSQLFAKALEEFISNHNKDRITEKLNDLYSKIQISASDVGIEMLRRTTNDDTW
jgi:metal-responsive CopG/Arc/MetJ family transcriptional regulator